MNETTSVRTLAVLSAVWQQLSKAPAPGTSAAPAASQLHRYLLLLSPLFGTLTSQEARQGLAAAFVALSGVLPDLARPTRLLTALNRQSETTIGEIDYDSSLAAYSELQKGLWMELKKNEGLPLMYQCFWDLCNPNDLALRHAAAQVHTQPNACIVASGATAYVYSEVARNALVCKSVRNVSNARRPNASSLGQLPVLCRTITQVKQCVCPIADQ